MVHILWKILTKGMETLYLEAHSRSVHDPWHNYPNGQVCSTGVWKWAPHISDIPQIEVHSILPNNMRGRTRKLQQGPLSGPKFGMGVPDAPTDQFLKWDKNYLKNARNLVIVTILVPKIDFSTIWYLVALTFFNCTKYEWRKMFGMVWKLKEGKI